MTKQGKNTKTGRSSNARKEEFLALFARESPHVRDSIAKDLPAYNALLGMHGLSFEDYAMQVRAIDCGTTLDASPNLRPVCPSCKTDQAVGRKEDGIFRCRTCGRTFTANNNSISSGTKCDALTWMKVLQCLLDSTSISKTCAYCDISETTYYKIRNRLFYAMQLMMDDVKLYGLVQVDNTFGRVSYKGMDLKDSEFNEDSIFFDDRYKFRDARKRGGAYAKADQNANSICIFTAIDDHGHVMARFAGIGSTSHRILKSYIPENKFLSNVPAKDNFLFLPKKKDKALQTKPGDKTLVVADKERAIESYIRSLNLDFESHMFRANGVQRRLASGDNNIQRVNALHHRLKTFLRNAHYVSTKYLPGYLILFEFVENTGASKEAINRLFQVLATPELGKPASFFREMYTVPNYLLEWVDGDNPLRKIPYNKRLAFYLYDHIRQPDDYPNVHITMEQIISETGYTAPSIRKFYRDLNEAGYRGKIRWYFGEPDSKTLKQEAQPNQAERKKRKSIAAPDTLNPIVLAIYDEYSRNRQLPPGQRQTLAAFLDEKNQQYGTKYTRTNMLMKFRYIEDHTSRNPLPDLQRSEFVFGAKQIPKYAFLLLDDYEALVRSYRERGDTVPTTVFLCSMLAEKYGISPTTAHHYISYARRYRKSHEVQTRNSKK